MLTPPSTVHTQHIKVAALKLKAIDFDSIFLADISPLLLGFLSELNKLGIPRKPVFSNYCAQMPDVLAAEMDNSDGVMYSYPNVPQTEDALGYFLNLAGQILARAVSASSESSVSNLSGPHHSDLLISATE